MASSVTASRQSTGAGRVTSIGRLRSAACFHFDAQPLGTDFGGLKMGVSVVRFGPGHYSDQLTRLKRRAAATGVARGWPVSSQ